MMVGISRRMKRAAGFSILAGVRVTRRNVWYTWIFMLIYHT